jgi:general secretion pathway protein G
MTRPSRHRRPLPPAGITLIEMLVVITIIALFSAVAYQRLSPAVDKGRITAAKTQIEALAAALQTYHIEKGRFPSTEEGLQAVRPYLGKDIPLDPWGNPYIYKFPGDHGPEPDILSYGADGQLGGEGVNADIVSWK